MDHQNAGPKTPSNSERGLSTVLSDNDGKARSFEIYNPGIYIYRCLYLFKFIEQRSQISDKVVRILGQVCPHSRCSLDIYSYWY